jgi:adenylate cyclase
LLLTFICVVPNPFDPFDGPTAMIYRFDNFIYFFVLLAVGTLAYSWRTVFSMGTWVAAIWAIGLLGVVFLGRQIPELTAAAQQAFAGYPFLQQMLDPNLADVPHRVQEIVVFFIVAAILALKGWRSNQLLTRQAQVAAERANLSRYFPDKIVNLLASSSHDIGSVRSQNVAVLFADIVGFTPIAEGNPPEKVMQLLRRYHAVIERAIFENGGTLDKYLGDGVMATFGTPETGPDDALHAFRAGWRIVEDMAECNCECAAHGDPQFQVSVGVHYGPVIIGDIGPSRRLEFAVVGDTVNVANRLEAETRRLRCRMVVSDELVRHLRTNGKAGELAQFRPRRSVRLRGRSTPLDIWIGGKAERPTAAPTGGRKRAGARRRKA